MEKDTDFETRKAFYLKLLDETIESIENTECLKSVFDTSIKKESFPYTPIQYKAYKKQLKDLIEYSIAYTLHDYNDDHEYVPIEEKTSIILGDYDNFFNMVCSYGGFDKVVYLYTILMIFYCFGYTTIFPDSEDLDDTLYRFVGDAELTPFWFRGVSNFNYDLVPSMYRSITEDYVNIDYDYVDNKYRQAGLTDSFEKIFSSNNDRSTFWAYMQHSTSFSPLIDFSESLDVAGAFATKYDGNPDKYECEDAAIYFLAREEGKSDSTSKLNIEFFRKPLNINSIIFGNPIYKCKVSDFEVKYRIISEKTNDRMKYQKGVFLEIRKGVFVCNKLMFPATSGFFFKLRIPAMKNNSWINKNRINDCIKKKHPEYSDRYLLDPYLFFQERQK